MTAEQQTFLAFYPAGIDIERNYVTITLSYVYSVLLTLTAGVGIQLSRQWLGPVARTDSSARQLLSVLQ